MNEIMDPNAGKPWDERLFGPGGWQSEMYKRLYLHQLGKKNPQLANGIAMANTLWDWYNRDGMMHMTNQPMGNDISSAFNLG